MTKKITWVQLSDMHVGQREQWMWPNFKSNFLEDLKRQSEQIGPIDLVIFSGDLTQKGTAAEFQAFSNEMLELWEMWDKIGQKPSFFSVPGNHDLVRPAANDARLKILNQWNQDTSVQDEFWSGKNNQYLGLVNTAFANYSKWQETFIATGIPVLETVKGIVPGDASAKLQVGEISVGLVGLNSSFLQLGDIDYYENLSLDLRQLNAVTEENPPKWCDSNDLNFLVTHHPPSWLSSKAKDEYKTEIFPDGRFTAHFFGHMHDAQILTEFRNGGSGRRTFQSSSLFGLETFGNGNKDRIHGYSLGEISISEAETSWKLWPRKARNPRNGATRKIIPDHENFELEPNEEFQYEKLHTNIETSKSITSIVAKKIDLAVAVEEAVPKWEEALSSCAFFLEESEPHLVIRPLQRRATVEGIRQNRASWVCADWELGRNGFLWSVIKKMGREQQGVYKFSLGNYNNRTEFLETFATSVGCSFPEFCKALAQAGPCILVFDDAPISSSEASTLPIERDVEKLAEMVCDFCPEVIIFIYARTSPQQAKYSVVNLEPLDEADTKSYLIAHPGVSAEHTTIYAVNDIFRRTDGVIGRIDSLIRTLRVSNLADLGPAVPFQDVSVISRGEAIPLSLIRAVAELLDSDDPTLKRYLFLLKVLAILPHGESISKLKRIDPIYPVYPAHAEGLLDRDLLQVRTSSAFIRLDGPNKDRAKVIFASRPVRDYIISKMSQKEINDLVQRAISMYFGEKWKSGKASIQKLSSGLTDADGSLLENPHALVVRLLEQHDDWTKLSSSVAILNLCQIYCNALHSGKHYRNCANVCRDVLSMMPKIGFESHRTSIEYLLATSLRMSGESLEAKDRFEALLKLPLPKDIYLQVTVNLAMCLQVVDDPSAIDIAREALALGATGAVKMQIESIILEIDDDEANKGKLLELEQKARSRGFDTVANNLALGRLSAMDNSKLTLSILRKVLTTSIAATDSYTAGRAAVRIAECLVSNNSQVSAGDLNGLISAYQYLYGERFNSLFERAHSTLWAIFEQNGDIRNLLSLFKHSSFIWRIHGREEKEQIYVKKLVRTARKILTTDPLTADRNTAYFLVRAQHDQLSQGKS